MGPSTDSADWCSAHVRLVSDFENPSTKTWQFANLCPSMFANAGLMGNYGEVVPGGINNVAVESMRVSGAPAKGLIACTYLFVASYAPTWGPVSWVYPPELYPLRVRGKAVAFATSGNWAFNTALGAFVPVAFENIRWKTYLIFGVFNFAMFWHVFFSFPETAGKGLEDVTAIFEDPNGIKYIGVSHAELQVIPDHTLTSSRLRHGRPRTLARPQPPSNMAMCRRASSAPTTSTKKSGRRRCRPTPSLYNALHSSPRIQLRSCELFGML